MLQTNEIHDRPLSDNIAECFYVTIAQANCLLCYGAKKGMLHESRLFRISLDLGNEAEDS